MIDWMISEHGLDRKHAYVTGLSAGGAMTSVLLATYPEVFAGGAVIAGLPFGVATDFVGAIALMKGKLERSSGQLGDEVRAASPHHGPWPKVSIWQGDVDTSRRGFERGRHNETMVRCAWASRRRGVAKPSFWSNTAVLAGCIRSGAVRDFDRSEDGPCRTRFRKGRPRLRRSSPILCRHRELLRRLRLQSFGAFQRVPTSKQALRKMLAHLHRGARG